MDRHGLKEGRDRCSTGRKQCVQKAQSCQGHSESGGRRAVGLRESMGGGKGECWHGRQGPDCTDSH